MQLATFISRQIDLNLFIRDSGQGQQKVANFSQNRKGTFERKNQQIFIHLSASQGKCSFSKFNHLFFSIFEKC